MANKSTNLNVNIKVNGKELDLTKTSAKEFNTVIRQAKTELNNLPLNDPRYKVLAKDIKSAEEAWIAAKKGATDFNDEMENGDEKVKTYKQQIKDATVELFNIEKQFGKNSEEYKKQQGVLASLRDEQEKFTRTTQDLDDTLAAIPGPIGRIGQGMQMLEGLTQNVGSAMTRLGISFKTFDGILKASGIGALVLLIGTLVAGIISAAKKSEALTSAFAAFGDAIGAIMDAVKPFADFLINIFVGAINLVSDALTGLASVFGGVNRGFKQQSVEMERQLRLQKTLLDNFNTALSANLTERLKLQQDFLTKQKEIIDGEYKNEGERQRDLLLLNENYQNQLLDLRYKEYTDRQKRLTDIAKLENKAFIDKIDNQRRSQNIEIGLDKLYYLQELDLLKRQNEIKKGEIQISQKRIRESNIADKDKLLEILDQSYSEQVELGIYYADLEKKQRAANKEERLKREREFSREDTKLINQRSNDILQLTTGLIKEENARNLQAAKDAVVILKEQQRVELEDARLAGVSLKKLKEKQQAETKAANEKVRLEQIQYDAYIIQLEIDKQNRLATEVGQGTQEYFDARRTIIQKEFEQELLLADGNQSKIEDARTNHWKKMLELDKEGVQSQISQLTTELNSLYEGTAKFYEKEREIERENYRLAQLEAQGNYDKLEALRLEHERKMKEIDISELQAKLDFEKRKADTLIPIFGGYFREQRRIEEEYYNLRLKAAGDNTDAIAAIEAEHAMTMRQMRMAEIQTILDFASKIAEVTSSVFTAVQAVNDARMAKELKDAGDNEKKQEEIKKKYFEKSKKNQIAQAYIATFQSAVQAFASMAGIPVVGPALGAVAAAAAIVAGLANVAKIKATTYDGGTGSGSGSSSEAAKPSMPNYLRNYEDGGLIGGRRHAEGGTLIEAEKGEAIMTRGAVTMFAPLLSMMNQMGGGAAFAPSLMTTSFDKPTVSTPAEDNKPMIIKSYVVSNELTNEQQRQARLKDLSTL